MFAWFLNLISLNENEFKFCSSLTQCFLKSESCAVFETQKILPLCIYGYFSPLLQKKIAMVKT